MSTTTTASPYRPPLGWAIADSGAMAQRNLIGQLTQPQTLVFALVQPVMFILLFRYVFGGAIEVPGGQYVNYLMAGIFVQTVAFGGIATAIGMVEDMQAGLIDRLRSLPMARSAVLAGRVLSDLARNAVVLTVMVAVAYAVGFRPAGPAAVLAGVALLLALGFTFSWYYALVGLLTTDAEAAQGAAFTIVFPLTFASSAFVPIDSMPGWLQGFAANQPLTRVIDAARALFLDQPLDGVLLPALLWIAGLTAALSVLAINRYSRTE